jgi:hypothetical protein
MKIEFVHIAKAPPPKPESQQLARLRMQSASIVLDIVSEMNPYRQNFIFSLFIERRCD